MRTHGCPATYNHGCRCQACTTAATCRARRYRRRRLSPEGRTAMCYLCGQFFFPKGLPNHMANCNE